MHFASTLAVLPNLIVRCPVPNYGAACLSSKMQPKSHQSYARSMLAGLSIAAVGGQAASSLV